MAACSSCCTKILSLQQVVCTTCFTISFCCQWKFPISYLLTRTGNSNSESLAAPEYSTVLWIRNGMHSFDLMTVTKVFSCYIFKMWSSCSRVILSVTKFCSCDIHAQYSSHSPIWLTLMCQGPEYTSCAIVLFVWTLEEFLMK